MSHNAHGKVSKFEDTSINRVKKQKWVLCDTKSSVLGATTCFWKARKSHRGWLNPGGQCVSGTVFVPSSYVYLALFGDKCTLE